MRLFERLTIRAALFIGFALILALWLSSGYDLLRRLGDIQARASAIDARYTRGEELLLSVRTQILTSAVYIRDALLDNTLGTSEIDRQYLHQMRRDVEKALQQYSPAVDSPSKREIFARLKTELDEYWTMLEEVLEAGRLRSAAEARAILRRSVIPRYALITQISDEVHALNRAAFDEQQAELQHVHRSVQQQFWTRSVAALFVGLLTAWFVTRHAGHLEAQLRQQLVKDAQNARDLQRLSAKLVSAQEDERRTIARELHDEIGQALTAIRMELGATQRDLKLGKTSTASIEQARGIVDQTLHAVRDLSQLLHPAVLDDLGLPAALDWNVRRFSARGNVRAELVQRGIVERLAPVIETTAYRIAQEALTNIARHSGASSCRVYLERLPETVRMTVEDNGRGFDPSQLDAERRGLGLLGIRERVTHLRGTFRLESAPDSGTRLTAELPALLQVPSSGFPVPGSGSEFPVPGSGSEFAVPGLLDKNATAEPGRT